MSLGKPRPACKNEPMQWDDLRVLLALTRAGTLTRAARQLGVNHTTVSRRIAALEDQVGVRLFERLPTGYQPTEAGDEVRRVAERMEEEILGLDRAVLGADTRLAGSLRITTLPSLAEHHAGDMTEFHRRYPLIELELNVAYAVQNLTRREADIAIRATNNPDEHLVGRRAGRLEFAVFAARSLVEADPDASLGQRPWLGWHEKAGARMTEAWMAENAPDAHVVCRFDDALALRAAVRAGLGVMFLPISICRDEDDLVQLAPALPHFGMDLWLLTHPDLRRTARVRAFMEFFGDRCKAAHPSLEVAEDRASAST